MIYIVSALQMLILITGGSHIRLNEVDEKTTNQTSLPWGGTEGGFLIGFY